MYNIFVERLWKSIKDEEVNLKAYTSLGAKPGGNSRFIWTLITSRETIRVLTEALRMRATMVAYPETS